MGKVGTELLDLAVKVGGGIKETGGEVLGARFQAKTTGSREIRWLPLEVMVEFISSTEQRGGRSM